MSYCQLKMHSIDNVLYDIPSARFYKIHQGSFLLREIERRLNILGWSA